MEDNNSSTESNEEGVLSDVHVNQIRPPKLGNSNFISRYPIFTPQLFSLQEKENVPIVDSEGDFVIPRKRNKTTDVISIVHHMDTVIEDVGLQVWRGAMLMNDFIIHNNKEFQGKCVIELGCGCGFSGIVASRYSKHSYVTDTGDGILENCERNVVLNSQEGRISMRELNFGWVFQNNNNNSNNNNNNNNNFHSFPEYLVEFSLASNTKYPWTSDDIQILKSNEIVFIGADIIYSNDLTTKLFSQLKSLLYCNQKNNVGGRTYLYLAMEKRINFSVITFQDITEEYDYLISFLELEGEEDFSISGENDDENDDERDDEGEENNEVKVGIKGDDNRDYGENYEGIHEMGYSDDKRSCDRIYDGEDDNEDFIYSKKKQKLKFQAKRIELDFPQYFEYERVEELELYQIWL